MTRSAKNRQASKSGLDSSIEHIELKNLKLDTRNPRFGGSYAGLDNETSVLDTIVNKFGVEDVLSSIAVNGFFDAEPLVGIENQSGDIRIVEGNRRLAACLILAGDKRAANQANRTADSQALQEKHRRSRIDRVPVRVYSSSDWPNILPYLGVRHIAASQPWDSFAKAAWIAQVLKDGEMNLDDIVQMIGDQYRTAARMLEGYYFTKQLIESAHFNPSDSMRKGRGSNPDYPFSWIYTSLGFKPVRKWLDLADNNEENRSPIKKEKLPDAGHFMNFLLGNKTKKLPGAITDSREIADLAKAVAVPSQLQLLKRGKSVAEAVQATLPAKEIVQVGLMDAQESLERVSSTLDKGEVSESQAIEALPLAKAVFSLGKNIKNKLARAAEGDDDEDG